MKPRKSVSASPYPRVPASSSHASRARWLTQIAFVFALALVACRVLMPESTRDPIDALSAVRSAGGADASLGQTPQSPGPAGGLVLDLLFCIPALLVLCRRAFDAEFRLHFSWSHVPMALLAILAILSPRWAADKFESLVSAMHLAGALVLLWAMSQIVRQWLRLRIVAGVCIGLLMSLAMIGYSYHCLELRDLRETWNNHKAEILAQHGWPDGSFQAQNFEKRILNGEPPGFSTSTNTYAALLVILATVSAGVIVQRLADEDHWGWILIPAVAIALTNVLIHWTHCRAAYVTPIIAMIILLAAKAFRDFAMDTLTASPGTPEGWGEGLTRSDAKGPHPNPLPAYRERGQEAVILRPWVFKFRRISYWLIVLAIGIVTAAIIHHGLATGNLWHDSLTFRWRYWVGSYHIVTSGLLYNSPRHYFNFLFGVGWENFGPYYLVHRLAIASEEIRDPHNFIVRTVVELGIVGGVLLVAWMLRLWWELTSPVLPAGAPAAGQTPRAAQYGQPMAILTVASIAIVAIAINIAEAIDFDAGSAYAFVECFKRIAFLFMLMLGMTIAGVRRARGPRSITGPLDIHLELDERPAPWMLYAILAALATFLIHNLIEFSLLEPAPMFLFAMLTGAALGVRAQGQSDARALPASSPAGRRAIAGIGAAAATLGWLLAAILVVTPIVNAESLANDADTDTLAAIKTGNRRTMLTAAGEMAGAFHAVPFNADYARRSAALYENAGGDPKKVKEMLDAAVAADHSSVNDLLMRAQFERSSNDPNAELDDYRHAIILDPRNVRMRLEFARELLRVAKLRHDPTLAGESALEFYSALDNNAQLSWDEVKRLTSDELASAHHDEVEAENFR